MQKTEENKKLLEIINEFFNMASYKINIQQSITFLYSNKKQSEDEIKIITFTMTLKTINT